MIDQCFPIKYLRSDEEGNRDFEFCFCGSCCAVVAGYMRKAAELVLQSNNKLDEDVLKDE